MQSIRGWEWVRVRQEVETEIELPKLWEKTQIKMVLFPRKPLKPGFSSIASLMTSESISRCPRELT